MGKKLYLINANVNICDYNTINNEGEEKRRKEQKRK
jgi:hypothetical protein